MGCVKGPDQHENKLLNVSANLANVRTKTYLGEVEDGRRQVYWSVGDAINLNGYESLPLSEEQAGKATADFQLYNGVLPYNVIYPASICGKFSTDGTVTINVPSKQEYSPNSFGKGSAILYGYSESDDEPITLHNLCAAVKVSLNSAADVSITKAIIISNSASAPVAGKFTMNPMTGEYSVIEGITSIILDIVEVSLVQDEQSFYFTIPYGEYPEGLTVKFYDAENYPMECVWLPKEGVVNAGKLYEFKPVDFVRGAKEILTGKEWQEIVSKINKQDDSWKKVYLSADNTIKLGADIVISEGDYQIKKSFPYTLDGMGHTLTIENATVALINTLDSGTIRNLKMAGKMHGTTTTQGYVESAAFVRTLKGGTIENCINEMHFDINEKLNVIFGTFVRDAKEGVMRNCVNNADVDVIMDVTSLTSGDIKSFGGGLIAGCSGPTGVIEIDRCVNNGAITVTLTRGETGGISRAGFGGIVGYAYGCTIDKYPKMTSCVNNGNVLLSADEVTTPIKAQASVGGIIGLAAMLSEKTKSYKNKDYPLSYSSIGPITSSNHCYIYLYDCKNTAEIRNNSTSSCDSKEYDVKIYTGGLAGTIVGKRDNHAKIINCVNTGEVIPYSVPLGSTPYSRAAVCGICGGFLGLGGYVDIEGGTMDASVGTAVTHSFAVAGVIGLAISKFSISQLNVDARISRVAGSDISKNDHALVVTNNTDKFSLEDNYNNEKTQPLYTGNDTDIRNSVIKDCNIAGSFFVSSVSYKEDPVYPSKRVKVTEDEILKNEKIVSSSYTLGDIEFDNNKYWSK